jgi:excisionase family DNA binding protein
MEKYNPFDDIDTRPTSIEATLLALHQSIISKKPQTKKFYTVNEASKELKVSVITVYRLAKLGKIPSRKIGARVLIPREFVEE